MLPLRAPLGRFVPRSSAPVIARRVPIVSRKPCVCVRAAPEEETEGEPDEEELRRLESEENEGEEFDPFLPDGESPEAAGAFAALPGDPIDAIAAEESMDERVHTMNKVDPARGPNPAQFPEEDEDEDEGNLSMLPESVRAAIAARQGAAGASQRAAAHDEEDSAGVPGPPPNDYPTPPSRSYALIDLLEKAGVESFADDAFWDRFEETQVTGVSNDSRKTIQGDVFICIKGSKADGHDFASEAVERGASVVVSDRPLEGLGAEVPVVVVPNTRDALSKIAASFFEYPSRRMRTVGVTGTNGKTTTTWLIRGIFEEMEQLTGIVGTIEYALAEDLLTEDGDLWYRTEEDPTLARECTHPFIAAPYRGKYRVPGTTPDALRMQKLLAGMADRGAEACVMECSSIGLDQGRCDAVDYDIAVFTNLSRDHLDYHKTEEAYKTSKLKLFSGLSEAERQRAVVNIDDPHGNDFKQAASRVPVITYAVSDRDADVFAEKISTSIWETEIIIRTPVGRIKVITPLLGKMNVYNVLAAVSVGLAVGAPLLTIVKGIEAVEVVPGRCEIIDEGQPFSVVVDYAHTADALSRLLDTVREAGPRRIILVFGCGGDRDKGKRPYMGEAAHFKADIVIVTNDNPRGEDSGAIVQDIVSGFPEDILNRFTWNTYDWLQDPVRVPNWYRNILLWCQQAVRRYVIEDRFLAIRAAMFMAGNRDCVVIAGKGHEDYQIFSDGKGGYLKGWFDDRVEARNALSKLVHLDAIKGLNRYSGLTIPAGKRPEDPFTEVD